MNKLLTARGRLAKNSKKGFTLVELIIVIIIIAILISALMPAVLGAVNRANRAANEADIRNILTAISVWALDNPTVSPAVNFGANTNVNAFEELKKAYIPSAGATMIPANFTAWIWDGRIATGVTYTARGITTTYADGVFNHR